MAQARAGTRVELHSTPYGTRTLGTLTEDAPLGVYLTVTLDVGGSRFRSEGTLSLAPPTEGVPAMSETKEEFRIVLTLPDEIRGRAYIRTEFHDIGGRRFPKAIIREEPEGETAPSWPRDDAQELADMLAALFPQTTIELEKTK